MKAAARILNASDIETRAELFGKLKRWKDAILPESDPGSPVQRVLLEAFRGTLTPESIKVISSKRIHAAISERDLVLIRSGIAKARQSLSAAGLEEETLVDSISSLLSFEKTGDEEHGYRVKVIFPGSAATFSLYVVREDGKYRILGGLPTGMEGVGAVVLDLLDRKDIKGAQWWLDRAAADAEARTDGTGRPSVTGLWSGVGEQNRGPAAIRLAAAALIGGSIGSSQALTTLEHARLTAPNATDRSQIDQAICETLVAAKRWSDLMPAARRLETSMIFHEEGFRYFVKAATRQHKWKELETEAITAIALNQQHVVAMRALVLAKSKHGAAGGAGQWARKISKSKLASMDEQIYATWFAIGQGKTDRDLLARMKKEKERAGSSKAYAYTVAYLEATLGLSDDAEPVLAQAIAGEDFSSLPAEAWAIHGRICEQSQLAACAQSSLEKARALAEADPDGETSEWLLSSLKRAH